MNVNQPTTAAEWRARLDRPRWNVHARHQVPHEELDALLAYCERLEAALPYFMTHAQTEPLVDADALHRADPARRTLPQASPENVSSRAARGWSMSRYADLDAAWEEGRAARDAGVC